ncbi:hypothetical protein [Qipengyuania pacifica]|uniref:hypothetical protein n=1 Tax=Qipengyuania pacifica TaxID=2860199 RepID=UPI001C9D93E1|nr:hypothetical protein [Qipengyuania pacifica]MBY8335225.1 hypothetical protein [Qipengyuania pacifica]
MIAVIAPIVFSEGLLTLIVNAFVWIGYDATRAVAGRWPTEISATRDFVFIARAFQVGIAVESVSEFDCDLDEASQLLPIEPAQDRHHGWCGRMCRD